LIRVAGGCNPDDRNPIAEDSLRLAETCNILAVFTRSATDSHLKMAQNPKPAGAAAVSLGKPLKRSFFNRSVHEVAPGLIGTTLLVDGVGGIITEVEAYHHTDPAAHSFNGPTPRNLVMFGPPGFSYVYRSYGIHWCVNFVCEKEGSASAVLIRALQPTHGLPAMRRRRGLHDERALCSGPGKLTEALGITDAHNGLA